MACRAFYELVYEHLRGDKMFLDFLQGLLGSPVLLFISLGLSILLISTIIIVWMASNAVVMDEETNSNMGESNDN